LGPLNLLFNHLVQAISLLYGIALLGATLRRTVQAYAGGINLGNIDLPLWPAYLIVPVGLFSIQVTFPLITKLGFDPVWFGVVSMMMVSMGLVFPPVGMIAFIVSSTANVKLMEVYKGTSILMISIVLTTLLIMIFPQIVLWLPATMR
jgi:hypothetical protein